MKLDLKKLVLIVFFVGLLATPAAMRWWSARHNQSFALDAKTRSHGMAFISRRSRTGLALILCTRHLSRSQTRSHHAGSRIHGRGSFDCRL